MKIGVVGDSHLQMDVLDQVIMELKDVDFIIHTGDLYYDYEYLIEKLGVPGFGVKGNCDVKGQDEIIGILAGKRFLITHGHQYGVKETVNKLFYRGLEAAVDVVIYGHSHIPFMMKEEGLILLNPGSLAHPRGGSQKGYAMIQIEEEIKIEFKVLKCADQNIDK